MRFHRSSCSEIFTAGNPTSASDSSDVKARYLRPLVLKCHRGQRRLGDSTKGRTDGWREAEGSLALFTLKMNFTASHISCPTNSLDGSRHEARRKAAAAAGLAGHAAERSKARAAAYAARARGGLFRHYVLSRILCKCAILSTGRRHKGNLQGEQKWR